MKRRTNQFLAVLHALAIMVSLTAAPASAAQWSRRIEAETGAMTGTVHTERIVGGSGKISIHAPREGRDSKYEQKYIAYVVILIQKIAKILLSHADMRVEIPLRRDFLSANLFTKSWAITVRTYTINMPSGS